MVGGVFVVAGGQRGLELMDGLMGAIAMLAVVLIVILDMRRYVKGRKY